MSEPWLSDLSEDWKTPSSSDTSSLPNKPPTIIATASSSPIASRIPRATQKSSTPVNSGNKARPAPSNSKRTLSERSRNDINIPIHSSSDARPAYDASRLSSSSSASSAASVVKLNTAARKAKSSSPVKPISGTPEWRKLVMKGQQDAAQTNLFSPMGLEGIFQKPKSTADNDPPKQRHSFSFLQDLDSMPSSPPPWPKSHQVSHSSSKATLQGQTRDSLGVLQEHDEDQTDDIAVSPNHEHQDTTGGEIAAVILENCVASVQTKFAPALDGCSDTDLGLNEGDSQIPDCGRNHADHGSEAADSDLIIQKERSSTSDNTSSVVGGFSPVFISKHNTADGRIDYAAVDLSNPVVLEHLRESLGFQYSTTNATGLSGAQVDRTVSRDLRTFSESKDFSNQHSLAPIGEFVSMERGGHSEEGSFMYRPLSPSTSSIVPSDSISQVYAAQNIPRNPIETSNSRDPEHESAHQASSPTKATPLYRQDSSRDQARLMCHNLSDVESDKDANLLVLSGKACRSTNESQSTVLEPAFDTISYEGSGATSSIETVLHRSQSSQSNQDVTISVPPGATENSKTFDSEPDNDSERPQTPEHGFEGAFESSPNKRTAPLPSKGPSPKRIRTLSALEDGPHPEYVSNVMEEQHRRMQAIIGKRKDARYDDDYEPCDPEALARREILRPRNLAHGQNLRKEQSNDSLQESLHSDTTLQTVQEHIDQATIDCNASDEANIKALASKVATIRIRGFAGVNGEMRKHSVSTQDYVDEAMKIMQLIRSNRLAQTELSNLEETGSDLLVPVHEAVTEDLTPQTISRPPSREGVINAWRTRDSQPLNSNVAGQLERYQEIEDESFMATSAFEGFQDPIGMAPNFHEESPVDEESVDIRIFGHLEPIHEDDETSLGKSTTKPFQPPSPAKTYGSNKSTDSSGRTVETTSTQKSRTLPVIGPEKVSHLLRAEEAGMRYDAERQTWVKCKVADSRRATPGHYSSSTYTEDDPFGAISDLSVNEGEPGFSKEITIIQSRPLTGSSETQVGIGFDTQDDEHHDAETFATQEESVSLDRPEPLPDECNKAALARTEYRNLALFEDSVEEVHRLGPPSTPSHGWNGVTRAYDNAPTPLNRLAKVPTESMRSKRRNVSVLFSSPPVAREYEAQQWSDPSGQSGVEDYTYRTSHNRSSNVGQIEPKSIWSAGLSPNQGLTGAALRPFHRELSLSCIDEHHEISLVGTRADGRSMSLTLSVSTPLPAHRNSPRPILQSSGLRNSSLWHSLSPLSEFSLHQDDSRHLQVRKLSDGDNKQLILPNRANKPAILVETLVQKLTDAEPDEPYWDFMRALHLERKNLDSLYMLDEFCPRIEELDVSENALQHLSGAPTGIRQLDVRNNRLSSLSSLEHLANLQYLDISGNGIESLEAFSTLVHLRELKAHDNNLTSIEGLLDLDGLLSLGLKRNKLEFLDFQGADMKRLTTLNADGNVLQRVSNIHCLPSLNHLSLCNNQLTRFPCLEDDFYQCHKLQSLHMARNKLGSLDLAFFPNLRYLDVDANRLVRISHIQNCQQICTLKVRSQECPPSHPTKSIADSLDDFCEVHHLYISGNLAPSPNMRTPFLNLKTLELAFAGVQSLPLNFGSLAPNLRILNLNSNGLKDLRSLRGIRKLQKLFVAANRLSRLRKTSRVLGTLPLLQEVDLRNNPLTFGYYPSVYSGSANDQDQISRLQGDPDINDEDNGGMMQHLLPYASSSDKADGIDVLHVARLDEETRLRRRVYEILLAAKCPMLQSVDGRRFERDRVFTGDETWERLVELGVVERVDGDKKDTDLGYARENEQRYKAASACSLA